MMAACLALFLRDLRLGFRERSDAALMLGFFGIATMLFPFAIGPDPELLRRLAPGLAWVLVLLAHMMALERLYQRDFADGTLEQILLSPAPPALLALAGIAAHWLLSGAPLVVLAPLAGLLLGLEPEAVGALLIGLLLGTPALSLIGAVGAALTLGARNRGLLAALVVLPLWCPVMIFALGAVAAAPEGASPRPHYLYLGALLLSAAALAPPAVAAALRHAIR